MDKNNNIPPTWNPMTGQHSVFEVLAPSLPSLSLNCLMCKKSTAQDPTQGHGEDQMKPQATGKQTGKCYARGLPMTMVGVQALSPEPPLEGAACLGSSSHIEQLRVRGKGSRREHSTASRAHARACTCPLSTHCCCCGTGQVLGLCRCPSTVTPVLSVCASAARLGTLQGATKLSS